MDLSFNQPKFIRVEISKPRFAFVLGALCEDNPIVVFLMWVLGSRKDDSLFVYTILVTNVIADFEDPHSTHRILTRAGF